MSRPADDDDPEIEVAPLRAPLVRAPRATNPAIDNVITSGEIAPRSHVVRSTQQNLPLLPRPPETAASGSLPAAPRGSLRWLWFAGVLVGALGVAGLTVLRPMTAPPAVAAVPTTDVEALAELVGTTFDGETRAVQVRAEAIASSSMLRAAIQTDARTLSDMSKDRDVVFPIAAHELLEVVQLRDGARTSLLRLPAGRAAPETPAPAPGATRLAQTDGLLGVVVDVPVLNAQDGSVGGEVVLAAPLDLARIKSHVPARASGVTLIGAGAPILLAGTATATPPSLTLPVPYTVAGAAPLALVVYLPAAPVIAPTPPSWFQPARLGCLGLAGLCLVFFLLGLVLRARRA